MKPKVSSPSCVIGGSVGSGMMVVLFLQEIMVSKLQEIKKRISDFFIRERLSIGNT
jgi:hypothetical protein